MAALENVKISRGLLTGTRADDTDVAVPVQPSVVYAAGMAKVKDIAGFRFDIDDRNAVSAVRVESGSDRMHRFFDASPAWIRLGGQTYSGRTRDGHELELAIPGRGADLFQALALLRRSHPRGAPTAGVVVTARFADKSAQRLVRQEAAKSNAKRADPWSPAWHERTGQVVGALTISRLFHGEPKGRNAIAERLGITLPQNDRQHVVETTLGLVWVSRIAVDAPYRDQAIGTELLRTLRIAIGATLPWEARLIEVLQSVPSARATAPSKFFSDAGYQWDNKPTYTAPARLINDQGVPDVNLTPLRTLYYWADIDPPQ